MTHISQLLHYALVRDLLQCLASFVRHSRRMALQNNATQDVRIYESWYVDNWYNTLGEGSARQEVPTNTRQYIRGGQHDTLRSRNLGTVHASAK